ncbi:MAG: helix-turn-helix domain-containing protein [Sporichthyaceae bacterium]
MSDDDFAASVSGVSALAEPLRRRLYLYVAAQPDPVGRDQAAAGVGIARHTAKFHLDRLVDDGLLETEFRRLSGRGGPGAGRPAKLYRRAAREVSVSLPERRYDLAGEVLVRAIEEAESEGMPVLGAVRRVAAVTGRQLAADLGSDSPPKSTDADRLAGVLAACGFEPRVDGPRITLANCPFHALARTHTGLVCGMNLALVGGVIDGLGCTGLVAELEPDPGRCCVTTRTARS